MNIHTSVVMTIHNRASLLERTLHGYARHGPYDATELVIVDDASTDNPESLLDIVRHSFRKIRLISIDIGRSWVPFHAHHRGPALGLNVGTRKSEGKLVILTTPDCLPLGDVIRKMQEITGFGERKIYCFGKASKAKRHVNNIIGKDGWFPSSEKELLERIPDAIGIISVSAKGPRGPYPFFAGIRKKDFESVNGIDEEYLRGYCYDDEDFSHRIKRSGVPWEWRDECCVLHQWHPILDRNLIRASYELNKRRFQDNNRTGLVVANEGRIYGSDDVILKETVYQ